MENEHADYTSDLPEMVKVSSNEYSDAHYRFLSTLIESDAARAIFQQIAATDFSHQCVNAFYKVITSGFDKNAILAANESVVIRKLDFEIALNLMVLECHESDIQNPAFLTFCENIKQMFNDFISRSVNTGERRRLLRQEFHVDSDKSEENPNQSKGILNKLGRKNV